MNTVVGIRDVQTDYIDLYILHNLKALDVELTPEQIAKLDAMTKPAFGFPQNMAPMFPAIHNGGTTVNGVSAPLSPFVIEKGDKPSRRGVRRAPTNRHHS